MLAEAGGKIRRGLLYHGYFLRQLFSAKAQSWSGNADSRDELSMRAENGNRHATQAAFEFLPVESITALADFVKLLFEF